MLNLRKCALALASVAVLAVPGIAVAEGMVGISMPTKTSARWIADGDNMVKQFQEAGYQTDLQYADDDIPNQLAQIENMITKGVNVLVIAAIDGTTLSNALANAKAADIKVIAYDRLIRDTPDIDYYATFDNFKVGVQQGTGLFRFQKLRDLGHGEDAARLVVIHQQGSTSLIQRKFAIGYNRAGRIMDQLEKAGIVGPAQGSKAREVFCIDESDLEMRLNNLQ